MRLPTISVLFLYLAAVSSYAGEQLPQTIQNRLDMQFVLVPAGEFLMGSDTSADTFKQTYPQYERKRFEDLSDEAPVHKVHITRAFYFGQHEVTVAQFRRSSLHLVIDLNPRPMVPVAMATIRIMIRKNQPEEMPSRDAILNIRGVILALPKGMITPL